MDSNIQYIDEELTIIADSSVSNGARNKSALGSFFEIQLENSLGIPTTARNINIAVNSAQVWYNTPNIITGTNDVIRISGSDTSNIKTTYDVIIPQGLYDLTSLENSIQDQLQNLGAKYDPSPLISLSADSALQKVVITLNYLDSEVDFTQAQSPRTLLGYDSQLLSTIAAPLNIIADNVAQLNNIQYYLISSDISRQGIRVNNTFNQVIARIPISAPPGSLLLYQPFKPTIVNSQHLAGSNQSIFHFRLTDQNGVEVDTVGEEWSLEITIRYKIPYHVSTR